MPRYAILGDNKITNIVEARTLADATRLFGSVLELSATDPRGVGWTRPNPDAPFVAPPALPAPPPTAMEQLDALMVKLIAKGILTPSDATAVKTKTGA